ncbi:MAG: class I SAM-dependent methyltransferase [Actinomycetota bacterium]|nr:class I SAM-dependent methyltransferase [Actinomycetota bacterium]MDP9486210.1 class I SAM-dependent methyltransferase [Actinomycetota bacterium]
MTGSDYDEIAGWYDEAVRSGSLALFHEFVIPTLLDLAGETEGRRVCDLACGQGIVARRLADRGAAVVGVDVSEGMLDLARRYEREEPRGVTYARADARTLDGVEDAAFDGVVCNLALMDIPDLRATLRTVARVLRPEGWFVFSITHPCFPTPSLGWTRRVDEELAREIPDYFAEGFWRRENPEGVRGRVGSHHRTLSTYVDALVRAGLTIQRLVEPRATQDVAERVPGYGEVPPFLAVRCEKPADRGAGLLSESPKLEASPPQSSPRRALSDGGNLGRHRDHEAHPR